MLATVTIDGLEFKAGAGLQEGYVYRRLQGWYSSPPMRGDSDERPNADGGFGVDRAFRSARPLRFEGALYADSVDEAMGRMWRAWSGIQGDGRPFLLTVTDAVGTLSAEVTLTGVAQITELDDRAALVEASFVAADPVKYAPERSVVSGLRSLGGGLEYPLHSPSGALSYGTVGDGGRVVLSNNGTAEVWPRFEVTGHLTDGFFLQCLETGEVLRYERVVPAGTVVTLDSQTGEVLVDGVSDASAYLVRDEWFPVPSDASRTVQFNAISSSSGTPELTAAIADGYW